MYYDGYQRSLTVGLKVEGENIVYANHTPFGSIHLPQMTSRPLYCGWSPFANIEPIVIQSK